MNDLFAPYSNETTSREAAESIEPDVGRLERMVFGKLPATSDQIEQLLNLSHQTVSARLRGLVLKGLVEASDGRAKTRSGRNAIIWQKVSRSTDDG
jgi:predicted transcriptional regulator